MVCLLLTQTVQAKERLNIPQMLGYDIILLFILFIVLFGGFWFLCVVPAVLALAL